MVTADMVTADMLGAHGRERPRRPVRVLTVQGDLRFGGDESRTLAFAKCVDPDRVDHRVATVSRPGTRAHPEMRDHYAAAGVEVLSLGAEDGGALEVLRDGESSLWQRARATGQALVKARALVERLSEMVRDLDIDVIDAHGEVPALIATAAGLRSHRPVAVTAYHLESREHSKVMWLAGQFAWGWPDTLVSDSYFATDLMRRWTLRQPRRLEVVRNGVFSPTTALTHEESRRALALPTDPAVKVVGQVSRLDPMKGHRFVIDAMPTVLERHPDTWFAFVGFPQDAAFPDTLRARARSLGVEDRLTITSYAGPIGDAWQAIDVHVHASLLESLPIAIAEGMSLGKPAVVTATAGTEEEVVHRRTGLVVPPEDPVRLAAGVNQLLDDPDLASGYGVAAAERYREMFQPDRVARQLEDLFIEIAMHAGRC